MHDAKGRALIVGDIVMVPCKVKEGYATEEFCNVQLETVASMPPGIFRTTITLNTKQVLRAREGDDMVYEILTGGNESTVIK